MPPESDYHAEGKPGVLINRNVHETKFSREVGTANLVSSYRSTNAQVKWHRVPIEGRVPWSVQTLYTLA
jgi:hypothetical protein